MSHTKGKQRIVFINQSSGYLMVDIVNSFSEAGYDCVLITGSLVERIRKLSEKVTVRKIIRYNNTSSFKRIFTWGWSTIQVYFIILFSYHYDHLFVISNPPVITFMLPILKNSFSLLIFDIYPDAITEFGILSKNSIFIKLWENVNRKVYPKSRNVFTITEGMKEQVMRYTGKKQVITIPLWSDNEFLKSVPRNENHFIKKHHLENKFVILYSGNIGISNDVEVLVEVAGIIDRKNITFVIIGGGARKKQIELKVKKEGLCNILILPWQDVSLLPYSLSSANIAVVALGKGASRLSIPSKIYSLISIGVPILGIASQESDLNRFINKYKIGKCFMPEQKKEIAEFITYLESNPEQCAIMTENALQTSKLFTHKNSDGFLNQESTWTL